MYLTSADFFSAELSIQTYGSAELNITKCIVASADWMVFPRISADFFSAELNITKCAPEFLLICMDFRRKFISLVTERPCSIFSDWLVTDPAAMDAMEEDWSEPEFQDTEFKVCPV